MPNETRGIEVVLSVPIFEYKQIIDGKPLEVDARYRVWKPEDGSHTCFFPDHCQVIDPASRRIVFRPNWQFLSEETDEWFRPGLHKEDFIFVREERIDEGGPVPLLVRKSSVFSIRDLATGEFLYRRG